MMEISTDLSTIGRNMRTLSAVLRDLESGSTDVYCSSELFQYHAILNVTYSYLNSNGRRRSYKIYFTLSNMPSNKKAQLGGKPGEY